VNTQVVGPSSEPGSVGSVRFEPKALSKMKVPWCAGGGGTGEFGASLHSASQSRREVSHGECPSVVRARTDPSYDLWCAA